MSRRIAALLALALVTAAARARAHEPGDDEPAILKQTYKAPAGPSSAAPKAPPAPGTTRPVRLPKPIDPATAGATNPVIAEVPPFTGIFGPAELIQQSGFASSPGDWVEFQVLARADSKEEVARMRVQEVLPAVEGARWIEILMTAHGVGDFGTRLLTRGLGRGNIERVIAKGPALAPMELPIMLVDASPEDGVSLADLEKAQLKYLGRAKATVPAGTFEVDKWAVLVGTRSDEFWIATDKSLRFARMVRLQTRDGVALLAASGTGAVAKIPVPAAAR